MYERLTVVKEFCYTKKALPVQKGGATSNDCRSVCCEIYRMSNYCWTCSLFIKSRTSTIKKETPACRPKHMLGFSHPMMCLSVCYFQYIFYYAFCKTILLYIVVCSILYQQFQVVLKRLRVLSQIEDYNFLVIYFYK